MFLGCAKTCIKMLAGLDIASSSLDEYWENNQYPFSDWSYYNDQSEPTFFIQKIALSSTITSTTMTIIYALFCSWRYTISKIKYSLPFDLLFFDHRWSFLIIDAKFDWSLDYSQGSKIGITHLKLYHYTRILLIEKKNRIGENQKSHLALSSFIFSSSEHCNQGKEPIQELSFERGDGYIKSASILLIINRTTLSYIFMSFSI